MAHPYQSLLFVDIETVPGSPQFMEEKIMELFKKRFNSLWNAGGGEWDQIYEEQGSLHAEFGKIACISVGRIVELADGTVKFFIRSKASKHEDVILTHLSEILNNEEKPVYKLVGHNAKEFDFPFIYRRLIVNGMPIPGVLNPIGKKPWEFPWEDTMEIWGAGQFKYKASLDLLCNILGIESPKAVITGADVADLYYLKNAPPGDLPFDQEEKNMKAIASYCGGDVMATAKVWCKFKGVKFPEIIEHVE